MNPTPGQPETCERCAGKRVMSENDYQGMLSAWVQDRRERDELRLSVHPMQELLRLYLADVNQLRARVRELEKLHGTGKVAERDAPAAPETCEECGKLKAAVLAADALAHAAVDVLLAQYEPNKHKMPEALSALRNAGYAFRAKYDPENIMGYKVAATDLVCDFCGKPIPEEGPHLIAGESLSCEDCADTSPGDPACSTCEGWGVVADGNPDEPVEVPCPVCHGTGQVASAAPEKPTNTNLTMPDVRLVSGTKTEGEVTMRYAPHDVRPEGGKTS